MNEYHISLSIKTKKFRDTNANLPSYFISQVAKLAILFDLLYIWRDVSYCEMVLNVLKSLWQ